MMDFRIILGGAGLFAIVAGTLWACGDRSVATNGKAMNQTKRVESRQQEAGDSTPLESKRLKLLESQVERLRRQVKQQSEQIATIYLTLESNARQAEDSSKIEVNPGTSKNESDSPAIAEDAEEVSILDREIADQQTDNDWSLPAADRILDILASETFLGSTVLLATCKETLCRLEIQHEDETALDRFTEEFPAHLNWKSEQHTETFSNEDGTLTSIVYISKESHGLPKESGTSDHF